VTANAEDVAFCVFLLFCRVGGCIILAPGLSSARIPMQIRLLVAIAIVLAVSPLLVGTVMTDVTVAISERRLSMILGESTIGIMIGLMGRLFLLGLQFAANTISGTIGLAGIPGVALEEGDSGSPLATLTSSAAVMMILALGLHIEMLKAIVESYAIVPVSAALDPGSMLEDFTRVLAETSILAVRLAAPFIFYGITINIALGLANRFVPQISFYHATTGLVMLVGFLLFHLLWTDWMMIFIGSYESWLRVGGF